MDMGLSKPQEIVKDRSLACCSPWGHKESDMTEWLNNNKKKVGGSSKKCSSKLQVPILLEINFI